MIFNPFESYELVTCGEGNIKFWNLNGRSLLLKCYIKVGTCDRKIIITTIAFANYNVGAQLQQNIICGDNHGDIGIVICDNYVELRKSAHKGMINRIIVTDHIAEKLLMITSGEDETICIWDSNFNQICRFNIRESGFYTENSPFNISA